MRTMGMPDTCTARHFYEMPRDLAYYQQNYDRSFTQERWDKAYGAPFIEELVEQLNIAKRGKIVNVFAFLIEGSQKTAAKILEDHGFTKVADYYNYKYADSSKRLWMYSMDMNNWTERKPTKVAPENPFNVQVPARQVPAAEAIAVDPVPRVAGVVRTAITLPIITHARIRGEDYRAVGRVNVPVKICSLTACLARRTGDGKYITPDGGYVREPFPHGEWVALPMSLRNIPPTLRGQPITALLTSGEAREWHWNTWTGDGHVVAVRRR